jgi:hypothetical protein
LARNRSNMSAIPSWLCAIPLTVVTALVAVKAAIANILAINQYDPKLYQVYSGAMPFSANSFFAFSFLAKCDRPMPRSTLGALVNWTLS